MFELQIGIANRELGILNIPIRYSGQFPPDNQEVELIIDDEISFIGRVDRTININGSVRIHFPVNQLCGMRFNEWIIEYERLNGSVLRLDMNGTNNTVNKLRVV
jgi:hypothetical protein